MKTLVMSVYCGCDRTATLIDLQRYWLDKTTEGTYDHAVSLRRIKAAQRPLFSDCIIVDDVQTRVERGPSYDHCAGLQPLLEFADTQSQYDCYLLLDSDCWPVVSNWQGKLFSMMKGRRYAAAVRCENFDTFYHPLAVMWNNSQTRPQIDVCETINLLGHNIHDVIINVSQGLTWPLMRSNAVNAHPLFAGVYGGLFFHVGCGSRKVTGRAVAKYNAWPGLDHQQIVDDIWHQLETDRGETLTARLLGTGC